MPTIDALRRGPLLASLMLLAACGSPTEVRSAALRSSPTPSSASSLAPSLTPATTPPTVQATTAAAPANTPASCRYATQDEVSKAIGQPVYRWTEAVGGCWYMLSAMAGLTTSVHITVYRNRAAQRDTGEVPVSGLGGTAYWYEDIGNLEVQVGRNVLWVQTGEIDAADKLGAAKSLVTLVRKRI